MKSAIRRYAVQAMGLISPRLLADRRLKEQLRTGEPELALIPILADPNRDFIDVGANVGVYAYYALNHFRRVVAVEAHPDLTGPLRRILGTNAQVLPVALSDHVGSARLWVPRLDRRSVITRSSLNADANPGLPQQEIEVAVTSIDALDLDAPAVIKIDVEGHEFAVLNGARETLKHGRPTCIVEVEERHNEGGVARAFAFFAALDYQAFFLHRGQLCPGETFHESALQTADHSKTVDGGRSADYVNNFLFVHRADEGSLAKIKAAYP